MALVPKIEHRDDRRGDKDGFLQVRGGVTGFSCEDGGVLEAAERAKGHLTEDAELEKGEWGKSKGQRMIFGKRRTARV